MNGMTFSEVVRQIPRLAAEGLLELNEAKSHSKHYEFLNNDLYLRATNDAVNFLAKVGKSSRFSQWQRTNCTPEVLQPLLEWHIGRPIAPGAIIAAALQLGFTMGVQKGSKPYFNFLARQIESELAQLRTLQQIRRVVHA